jgi:hypothetical protein
VIVQRTDLPIFFARIWGGTLANVSATATAEAYNTSHAQTINGYVPIAPRCVKPFLVPNRDPDGLPFVDTTTGKVTRSGFVGEVIAGGLKLGCQNGINNACALTANPPAPGTYVPALVTANTANLCPSCSTGAITNYEQSIGCCDATPYSCGIGSTPATVDLGINPGPPSGDTHNGVQCLIHWPGPDQLNISNFPTGPMQITAGSGPQSGNLVTTSSSIVTMPIFDDSVPIPTNPGPTRGQVTVVGFLQAFISDAPGSGDIDATILNVVGCGNNPSGTVISGGGITPIPVRLIHN